MCGIRATNFSIVVPCSSSQASCTTLTVHRTLKQHREEEPWKDKVQLGKPRKTTPEEDKFIVDTVENNRKIVPREVQKLLEEQYGVHLCLSKIRSGCNWLV